jgi:hypothetical protein
MLRMTYKEGGDMVSEDEGVVQEEEGVTHCPWCGFPFRRPLAIPPPPFCEGEWAWHLRWRVPGEEDEEAKEG